MIDAEGHTRDGFTRIAQNDGPVADAIRLAVYLEGWRPTFSRFRRTSERHSSGGQIGMGRPRTAVSMFTTRERIADQSVWCVSTELGSWTMLQGGHVMLTGNSVGLLQLIPSTFAAYAGPYRNTPPLVNEGGGPVSENAMAQIYAAIHYAAIAYDGAAMASVIGHGHGYDSGGWLPPGRSIAVNNTGQYERVTPPGGNGTMTPGEMAICAKLDALIGVTGTQGTKFAGALNSMSASAGQRGSYSTRR